MNYVESLDILGVEAKEIPCIKGTDAPTSSTPGAVGVLYITQSGALYKCISVANGAYAWDPVCEVLPGRGLSEKATMSQKALTELFDKNDIDVATLQKNVAAVTSKALRNDKRLANLEAGIPDDDFIIDNSTAYVRDVPANALPFAEVTEIGGVTRKCTNLCREMLAWTAPSVTVANGVATQTQADTKTVLEFIVQMHLGTTSVKNLGIRPINVAGRYSWQFVKESSFDTLIFGHSGSVNDVKTCAYVAQLIDGKTYTLTVDITNVTQGSFSWGDVTINEGETALPYEPFFEGLRSAPVTEVVSEGANLFDVDKRECGTIGDDGNLYITNLVSDFYRFDAEENTQYTLSAYVKNINTTGSGRLSVVYTDGSVDEVVLLNPNTEWAYRSFTTATGKTVALIRTYFGDSGAWYIRGAELMLNKGTTALPYRPYIKRTLPIPEAVRNLPDYGVGIPNTDYFNRIRWRYDEATDKWVREYDRPMKTTNLGTLNWQYGNLFGTGVYCFFAEGATDANNKGTYSIVNILCHLYDATTANEIAQRGTTGIALYEKLIVICDTNYTDAATFKSAMSGVMLVYELATPEITDISDVLPEDNLIGVEGGGSITMQNEYGYDVPAKITYQIEEEAV